MGKKDGGVPSASDEEWEAAGRGEGKDRRLTFEPGVNARTEGEVENARRATEPEARREEESIARRGREGRGTLRGHLPCLG